MPIGRDMELREEDGYEGAVGVERRGPLGEGAVAEGVEDVGRCRGQPVVALSVPLDEPQLDALWVVRARPPEPGVLEGEGGREGGHLFQPFHQQED